jgi:hypothetical protein
MWERAGELEQHNGAWLQAENASGREPVHCAALRLTRYFGWGDAPAAHARLSTDRDLDWSILPREVWHVAMLTIDVQELEHEVRLDIASGNAAACLPGLLPEPRQDSRPILWTEIGRLYIGHPRMAWRES